MSITDVSAAYLYIHTVYTLLSKGLENHSIFIANSQQLYNYVFILSQC